MVPLLWQGGNHRLPRNRWKPAAVFTAEKRSMSECRAQPTCLAAAQSDQACPINDHLSRCNELLFDIGIELREQRGGSLSLVSYQPFEASVIQSPERDLCRANNFLRWLLRSHVCIAGLELKYKWATAHIRTVLEELPENSRLKKLRVEFPYEDSLQTQFAILLPRLR
ncbi:hypothetical protein HPB51_006189 [Rhipicephalus microplus]|uniref:Uncharacterized protein n=1 Tax=Rhipicephalus microplus TaxID=6941 RepID=A0A9J6E680_RHIMP|nr:hypothetical protein HPB51_006189 [Rhipicephalus microplus]